MKYNIELIRLLAVVLITLTHTRHSITEDSVFAYFLVEQLPTIGTILLSIISGYLFQKISFNKPNFFFRKVKTLFIPFLIANLSVLCLVLTAKYIFDFNFLNRLSFDFTLITEGVLALNSPPINPPTYFIRDIFVIFVLIELIKNKNFYMLLIIIPLLILGKLLLRYDILVLFLIGTIIARYETQLIFPKVKITMLSILALLSCLLIVKADISIYKYPLALFVFLFVINRDINFYNTGAYSYLLHLYHSPIIVATYPIIQKITKNNFYGIFIQITLSFIIVYTLFLATRKIPRLRILCGNK